jgi:hypothetical protein
MSRSGEKAQVAEGPSPQLNAQKMCGALCLQHKVNEYLDEYKKGRLEPERSAGLPRPH